MLHVLLIVGVDVLLIRVDVLLMIGVPSILVGIDFFLYDLFIFQVYTIKNKTFIKLIL
jgi:hypothetical protein